MLLMITLAKWDTDVADLPCSNSPGRDRRATKRMTDTSASVEPISLVDVGVGSQLAPWKASL